MKVNRCLGQGLAEMYLTACDEVFDGTAIVRCSLHQIKRSEADLLCHPVMQSYASALLLMLISNGALLAGPNIKDSALALSLSQKPGPKADPFETSIGLPESYGLDSDNLSNIILDSEYIYIADSTQLGGGVV